MSAGRLYVPEGAGVAGVAETLAWLWRLGPPSAQPARDAVGVGGVQHAAELRALVRDRRLAGAVVLAGEAGGERDGVPARRRVRGTARFPGRGMATTGEYTVLAGGRPAVVSSLGVHAARDGRVLTAGATADDWGRLRAWWLLPAIAGFLLETLARPLVALPPIGCLRLDDAPGTAELVLLERAKPDGRERRRLETILRAIRRSGARLVVAVAARALQDGREVPLDAVWPQSLELLAESAQRGLVEPACHGLLHLDTDAYREGRIDPREFGRLDRAEAGRRLDQAIAWMSPRLGPPRSFVAPAWAYSDGALDAAAERGLPTWVRPAPRPLLDRLLLHETLRDGLADLDGLRYGPLTRMARIGLPPTVVFHGRMLDGRVPRLRAARDALALARLTRARDLERIARLAGVRWVTASELVERLRAHAAIEVDGARPLVPHGVEAILIGPRRRSRP